jgi:hypothetical protein
MRFEVFMEVKIQVEVFWVLKPCSVVVAYQQFGGPCCLHLQVEVCMASQPGTSQLKKRGCNM